MTRLPLFTSDTHFYHGKLAEHRGFKDVPSMNEGLIRMWNQRAEEKDTIYHLGDVSFAGFSRTQEVFEQLHGQVKIVPGNHDDPKLLARLSTNGGRTPVEVLPPLKEIKVVEESNEVQRVVLCHFPLRVWNRMHYGAWHFHGHSHGFCPPIGKMLDVGVDGPRSMWNPLSYYGHIKAWMDSREFVQIDQHNEKAEE